MSSKKRTSHAAGLWAENLAVWGLRLRGYRILAQRYKTPVGEIDIIARKGKSLAFIEVKARRELSTALESVTPRMKERITRAAWLFLNAHPEMEACEIRFDLIAIAWPFYWQHLDNAWS